MTSNTDQPKYVKVTRSEYRDMQIQMLIQMDKLLQSALSIAERRGEDVEWDLFAMHLRDAGITSDGATQYRKILERLDLRGSDLEKAKEI